MLHLKRKLRLMSDVTASVFVSRRGRMREAVFILGTQGLEC